MCDMLLASRMLPKWLQAFEAAAQEPEHEVLVSFEVLQSPECCLPSIAVWCTSWCSTGYNGTMYGFHVDWF